MPRFDPMEERLEIQQGRHAILDPPDIWYARYPDAAIAAEYDLERILRAWFVGESEAAAPRLAAALQRLEAACAAAPPLTPRNALRQAQMWRALALARWLALGLIAGPADATALAAGLAQARAAAGAKREARSGFLETSACDLLIDALLCGKPETGLDAVRPFCRRAAIPEDLRLALDACEAAEQAGGLGEAVGRLLSSGLARPGDAAFIRTRSAWSAARWLRLASAATGSAADAGASLFALYGLDPQLAAPSRDDPLEGAMAPPREGAAEGQLGALRWRTLQTALRADPPAARETLAALLRAGLADPDWRLRMTAMLGAGRLGDSALRDALIGAPVPLAADGLISQEDRRCLLLLHEAARERLGAPPSKPARAGGQAFEEAARWLAGDELPFSRLVALANVLIGLGTPAGRLLPKPWRRWAYG